MIYFRLRGAIDILARSCGIVLARASSRKKEPAKNRKRSAAFLDAFRRAAHSLKSTGETVGAVHLAALARELEAAARAGKLDGAEARVAQVDSAFEIASRTLEEIRRGLPE